jgi:hypothetical protein
MATMMPTVTDARRAPPSRDTWPRWLGFNLWRFACVLIAVAVALVAISALFGANDGDDPPWAAYAWMCLYLPFTWPLYMAALAIVAPRVRHPRGWAIALTPLLFALFPYAVVTFVVPGVAAAWVAYVVYGATLRLPPLRRPASGATSR